MCKYLTHWYETLSPCVITHNTDMRPSPPVPVLTTLSFSLLLFVKFLSLWRHKLSHIRLSTTGRGNRLYSNLCFSGWDWRKYSSQIKTFKDQVISFQDMRKQNVAFEHPLLRLPTKLGWAEPHFSFPLILSKTFWSKDILKTDRSKKSRVQKTVRSNKRLNPNIFWVKKHDRSR